MPGSIPERPSHSCRTAWKCYTLQCLSMQEGRAKTDSFPVDVRMIPDRGASGIVLAKSLRLQSVVVLSTGFHVGTIS
jgi:hypothetical protein